MPKMSRELEKTLRKQRKKFIRKFGREPGPNDPILFDENADTPQPMQEAEVDAALLEGILKAGTPPHLVYAYRKTGRIVGEEGYQRLTPAERSEWNAAIDEYFELEEAQAAGVIQ